MRERMHKKLDTYDSESIEDPQLPVTSLLSISMTTGTWSDAPYISLRISHILTFSTMRSLNTTVYQVDLASGLFLQRRTPTHVQSPTYAFHTAIEPIRKVSVMSDIWMTNPPNIDKLWGALGSINNVLERLRFI